MYIRKEYHVAVAFKYIVATVIIKIIFKITMKVITVPAHQVNMDVRKESHVAAALKYIEENLPVGEEGLYGLVNNAGVSFLGGGEGDDPLHFVRCVFAESLTGRPGVRYQTPCYVQNFPPMIVAGRETSGGELGGDDEGDQTLSPTAQGPLANN